jgi:hypothetical protein
LKLCLSGEIHTACPCSHMYFYLQRPYFRTNCAEIRIWCILDWLAIRTWSDRQ